MFSYALSTIRRPTWSASQLPSVRQTIFRYAKILRFLMDSRTHETVVTDDLIDIFDACDSGDHGGRGRALAVTWALAITVGADG
jgi:hypothetical protein